MKGYINEEDIENIRNTANIVDIISDYLPLKKSGANYVGLCPFHNEKTPSFTVSDTKQFFHCFGCGEGGDVVTFIMKKENLEFPDAVKFLADRLGMVIEEKMPKDKKLYDERLKAYEINKEAARFFHLNLNKSKSSLDYLYSRGIPNKVIKQFGLGYSLDSWDSLYKYLTSKGYKVELIEKLGLIGRKSKGTGYYDKFRNRIIFPIIDVKGRVIGFGGRVLDDSMPKYLNSQETIVFNKGNNLYGLNLLNKFSDKKEIILVEGYMDVISLFSNGINYSVASLGTALTDRQSKLLKRYGKEVYICYDSDKAGIKATEKAFHLLSKEDISPKIVVLEDYKDPDDYIRLEGLNNFKKKLKESYNYVDYMIYINKSKYDLNVAEDKIKFTMEISKVIRNLRNPIEKDVYIKKVSKEMDISKDAIEKEVYGNNRINNNTNNIKRKFIGSQAYKNKKIFPIKAVLPSGNLIAEIDLIKLALYDKDFFNIITKELSSDEFQNYECKEIFIAAKELYEKHESFNEDIIYKKISNNRNINVELMDKIFERKIKFSPENVEQIIEDLIKKVKLNRLISKRNNLIKDIEQLESQDKKDSVDNNRFLELCVELNNLNKELNLIKNEEGR